MTAKDSVISKSGNYKVDFIGLTDEKKEYKVIVTNMITNKEIASYEQVRSSVGRVLEFFFNTTDSEGNVQEWWTSAMHYMNNRLFVNCTKEVLYINPMNIEGECFIWAQKMNVTKNGKYLFILGCYWACPYAIRMYRFCPENAKYIYIDDFDDDEIDELEVYRRLEDNEELCQEHEKKEDRFGDDCEDYEEGPGAKFIIIKDYKEAIEEPK